MADEQKKIISIDEKRAQAGLALFEAEESKVEFDTAGATAFKEEHEKKVAELEAVVATLTGKDNKKARTEKSKEVSTMKNELQYIDACKVVKGLEPKNGFFMKKMEAKKSPAAAGYAKEAAPVAEEPKKEEKAKKEDKKPAKAQNAGISPDERNELEKLKKDIIERKTQLKAEGLSGGQQNKDAQVAAWVARMNELKEKECPGSTVKGGKGKDDGKKKKKGALSSEEQKEFDKLAEDIEAYRQRLVSEFGYGKKDIKADPEMCEMEAKLKAFEKRS